MTAKIRVALLAVVAAVLGVAIVATANVREQGEAVEEKRATEVVTPEELVWQPAPESLPRGARVAVLHGDPRGPGLFTIMVSFPADYRVPPHTHPFDERVTVLGGALGVGHGEQLDPGQGTLLPPGTFVLFPAGEPHHVWTTQETVFQLTTEGPFEIRYLDPADDPRQRRE
jgi:quercetin dioxygenase-like cupin family protein